MRFECCQSDCAARQFLGGTLLGFGARLAHGCNIGAYFRYTVRHAMGSSMALARASRLCVLFTCALLLVLSVVCAVASFLSRSTHGSGCVLRFLGAALRFYSSGGFQFKARAPLSGSTHEGSPNTGGIAICSWHGQFNAT